MVLSCYLLRQTLLKCLPASKVEQMQANELASYTKESAYKLLTVLTPTDSVHFSACTDKTA